MTRFRGRRKWLAPVLAAGPGALLSELVAAELWQARRPRATTPITVLSPRRCRIQGIKVHRANRIHPRDVTSRNGIPVTSMARTLVDLMLDRALTQPAGSAGTKSAHEDAFLAALASAGHPEPLVNTEFHGFEG